MSALAALLLLAAPPDKVEVVVTVSGLELRDVEDFEKWLGEHREVVSAESEVRDRERKPVIYAQAGIVHFWWVEETDDRPTVYVYELDPATRTYALMGIHHDRLKVSVPFDVDIDLTEADDL